MNSIVSPHPGARQQRPGHYSSSLAAHIHESRLLYTAVLAGAVVIASALVAPAGPAAWLALWAVAFAVAALFAPGQAGSNALLERWLQSQREARANEQLWQMAMGDRHIMADLTRAGQTRLH